jgi:hypothetical protein
MASTRKAEDRTAAEEQLAQRDVQADDSLEQDAKEQRKQQRQELKEGNPEAAEPRETPAAMHRSDHVQDASERSVDRPDQYTILNPNEQVPYGHFGVVTGGEHQGRFGVFVDTVSAQANGQPDTVTIRTRDANNELLQVSYDDLAPTDSRGNAPR